MMLNAGNTQGCGDMGFAGTGDLPIDNNPVENAIHLIALGKKTGYSPAPSAPANVQRLFKPCWAPPNLMALTLMRG
ncbi:hypothetical protein A1359_08760 [Methylomonas lenta]|uniref:Uncharacterized protein n=1 Tax=Methylomonas lenta TaxID=980561 RepID=A0A177NDG2_9GAMM|nr:hypothetical protein A1359_08760 [Methylomonas lenta]